jgi:hypothetical protein
MAPLRSNEIEYNTGTDHTAPQKGQKFYPHQRLVSDLRNIRQQKLKIGLHERS